MLFEVCELWLMKHESLQVVLGEPALGIHGGLATTGSSHDGLTITRVGDVATSKDTVDIGV